jgi:very-short-patch-repair endonuclease
MTGRLYNKIMKDIEVEAINSKRGCIGYLPQLTYMSKKNRNSSTEVENKIWNKVLRKRQTGFIFYDKNQFLDLWLIFIAQN